MQLFVSECVRQTESRPLSSNLYEMKEPAWLKEVMGTSADYTSSSDEKDDDYLDEIYSKRYDGMIKGTYDNIAAILNLNEAPQPRLLKPDLALNTDEDISYNLVTEEASLASDVDDLPENTGV